MKWLRKFVLVLSVFCLPWAARVAAEQSSPAEPGMAAEELLFQDIGSVFTASKFEQKVTRAPSRISIVTAEEIRQYGYRTMEDILKSLPGFYSTYDRNYAYSGVRGFSIPGDYDTKILLMVDGHRINENVYNCIFTDHAFILDLDLVERIEVVRGPGAALYGSNAFFGVINVITKSGRALQGPEVSGSVGSSATYQGRTSYGNRYANGMEVLLSGTYYDSRGEERLYYPELDDPATNNGIAQDMDGTSNGNLLAKAEFKDFVLTGAWVEMDKQIPTASYQTVFNDARNQTTDSRAYLDLSYLSTLSDTVRLSGRIAYDWYGYRGDYVYDFGEATGPVVNRDRTDGEWWTAEAYVTWDFLDNHRLVAGGEYRDTTEQSQDNYDIYGTYLDVESDIDTWGIFAQDSFSVSESIAFNLGLRYDYSSQADETINPRTAFIFTPSDETSFKLLYGTAFRAPNAYELYYDDDGLSQKSNEDLQPETIASYEFIAEHQFDRHIRSAASVFYNDIDDLIVLTTDPADQLFVFDNVGTAKAQGLELDLNGRWENGWSAAISYTYQNAENSEGNWLVNSPKHMAKLNVIIPLLAENLLSGGLEVQYLSERLTLDGERTDRSLVTNLTLLSRDLFAGLTLSVTVYNLFDDTFAYPVSDAHVQDSIAQQGRTFRLKIDFLL